MPPSAILSIRAPLCAGCVDSLNDEEISPEAPQTPMALCSEGTARMLLLRGIAVEPIPGPSGSLKDALGCGQALHVPARARLEWENQWRMVRAERNPDETPRR